jgi:hypothetical protein
MHSCVQGFPLALPGRAGKLLTVAPRLGRLRVLRVTLFDKAELRRPATMGLGPRDSQGAAKRPLG